MVGLTNIGPVEVVLKNRSVKRYSVIFVLGLFMVGMITGCVSVQIAPEDSPSSEDAAPAITYETNTAIDASWTAPQVIPSSQKPQMSVPDIVKKIARSVVAVHTDTVTYDIFLQPVPAQGVGTGAIIDARGFIITNNHVVENAKSIKVILYNGKPYDAIRVARDPLTDLAVVQITPDMDLQVGELGSSKDLQVGESVVAVGNALALDGGPTVTAGIVSYVGRSIVVSSDVILHDLIQTDAAINPGNSGGPLLNLEGQVVGINTATAANAQNIGFAIEISQAIPVIEQLIRAGHITRAYLGVELYTLDNGVGVIKVDAGSPAESAGLKPGDIITAVDGKQVQSAADLRELINSSAIGQSVQIVFARRGKEMHVSALLTASPAPSASPVISPST
jgi:S1-C subfamily serine protease